MTSSITVPTDVWLKTTWENYLEAIEHPDCEFSKGYYHNGRMRIEMSPVGNLHSRDHAIIIHAVVLFAGIKNIDLNGFDNCTYRKTGCNEAQPDASFYIGEAANAIDWDVTIVDLDRNPPPTLAIEVAYSSLSDDKGEKRLLYEAIGVSEYWIIDVQNVEVIAFSVANGGSRRITQSQVLPGLEIALLEEAFRRSRRAKMTNQELLSRITSNPEVMVGKPVIKGTRLTVELTLNLLAHGATIAEIVEEYQGLCEADIRACLLFAARSLEAISILPLTM